MLYSYKYSALAKDPEFGYSQHRPPFLFQKSGPRSILNTRGYKRVVCVKIPEGCKRFARSIAWKYQGPNASRSFAWKYRGCERFAFVLLQFLISLRFWVHFIFYLTSFFHFTEFTSFIHFNSLQKTTFFFILRFLSSLRFWFFHFNFHFVF